MSKVIETIYGMYNEKVEKFVSGSYTQNSHFFTSQGGAEKSLKYQKRKGWADDNTVVVAIEITTDMIKKINK